jgi:hypothetical protein
MRAALGVSKLARPSYASQREAQSAAKSGAIGCRKCMIKALALKLSCTLCGSFSWATVAVLHCLELIAAFINRRQGVARAEVPMGAEWALSI